MKRLTLALVALCSLLACGLFSQKASASTCTPSELANFPYGFFCPSSNTDTGAINFNSSEAPAQVGVEDGSGGINTFHPLDNTGLTLNFYGIFNPTDIPRTSPGGSKAKVLVWTTIDIRDTLKQSVDVTNFPGGAGVQAAHCPSSSRGTPPFVVYNYNHDDRDKSPAQYIPPSGPGLEDCLDQGQMVYWADQDIGAAQSPNYSFRLKLASGHSGETFCVRMNISVYYGSQAFPQSMADSNAMDTAAAHVAKQGPRLCYRILSSSSPAGSTQPECTSTYVDTGTYGGNNYPTKAYVWISNVTPSVNGYSIVSNAGLNNNSGNHGGPYNDVGDHTFNYTPTGNNNGDPTIRVRRDYYYTGDTESAPYSSAIGHRKHDTWYNYSDNTVQKGPCYDASCKIYQVDGTTNGFATPGAMLTFHALIYNDQPGSHVELRNGLEGSSLVLNSVAGSQAGFTSNPPPGTIYVNGDPGEVTFSVRAPTDGSSSLYVKGQALYESHFPFGGYCDATVQMYRPPLITLDMASTCGSLVGWAFSPLAPNSEITVTAFGNTYYTDVFRGDVNAVYGLSGNHGFSIPIPTSYFDGNDHNFTVVAKDPYGIQDVTSGSVTMTGCGVFHLRATTSGASLNPDDEDPTSFSATANITATYDSGWGGPAVGVPASGSTWFTKNDVPIPGTNLGHPDSRFINRSYPRSTPVVGPLNTGDKYCLVANISPKDGYVDRNGNIVSVTDAGPDQGTPSCDWVSSKPYFKVYGGSISAGGDFESAGNGCNGGGELASWYNNSAGPTSYQFGSSAELSSLAMLKISGVASGKVIPTRPPTEVTFSNTAGVGGSSRYIPDLGGLYGATGNCLDTAPIDNTLGDPGPNVTVSSLNGAYTHDNGTNMKLDGGADLDKTKNIDIYVKGNVFINSDIKYKDDGSWAKGKVPIFRLHVTGNIYISPAVTRLDGTYIAEPTGPGAGGTIYTCGNSSFTPMPKSQLYGNCHDQLTVMGSFIADHINMMRTYGSLRDEKTPGPVSGCTNAGASSSSRNTCAAEVFEHTLESYLTPPANQDKNNELKWDAITQLPPIL